MATMHDLHNKNQERFIYNCNVCKAQVDAARYHCAVCDDFDLCVNCYEKEPHPHSMEKLSLDSADDGPSAEMPANPQETKEVSMRKYVESLMHACQCRDVNCKLPNCQKIEKMVQHTKTCEQRTNGGCPICKQLIALCCYHIQHCDKSKCRMPFCSNIKHVMNQEPVPIEFQYRNNNVITHTKATLLSRSAAAYGHSSGEADGQQASTAQAGMDNQPESSGESGTPGAAQLHQETLNLSLQILTESLAHACQCKNKECKLPNCEKMKKVMQHTRICKRRTTNGGCTICNHLISLACYHSQICPETKCPVPFCSNVKRAINEEPLQYELPDAPLTKRKSTEVPTDNSNSNLSEIASTSGVARVPPGLQSPTVPAAQIQQNMADIHDLEGDSTNSSEATQSRQELMAQIPSEPTHNPAKRSRTD